MFGEMRRFGCGFGAADGVGCGCREVGQGYLRCHIFHRSHVGTLLLGHIRTSWCVFVSLGDFLLVFGVFDL